MIQTDFEHLTTGTFDRDVPTIDAIQRGLTAPGAPFETERAIIRGIEMQVWKNIPRNLRAVLHAARAFGDREAIVYEGERVTYSGFFLAAATLAHELVARGCRKGDRVAIAMRNLPEWPIAYFAIVSIGAIVTPLNAWGTAAELTYGLTDSGARFAIVDEERHSRIEGHRKDTASLERIYVARYTGALENDITVALEKIVGPPCAWSTLRPVEVPAIDVDPDDIASLYYTSGTTGRPKGAFATHRAVLSNIAAIPFASARAYLRRGEPLPASGPVVPKASLVGLPLFHVTGCNVILVPSINAGNKLVIMHKWDVVRAFELIAQERVTNIGGVPALAWQVLEHPCRKDFDLSSIERVNWGGAPASPELAGGIRAAFPTAAVTTGWGMTELSGVHTDIAGIDLIVRPNSCGCPVGDYKLKICDAAGNELPRGTTGELWAFGPNAAIGYWNNPDATAETFVKGWVKTGDIGYLDDKGFCFIVDRAKDMLIRGGENIYCIEVENAIYQHPAVVDAAVVGLPHRTLGEEPGAVVTLRQGHLVNQEELRAFVAQHLAAFKVPVRIVFTDSPLPRNPSGKILKAACKSMF